MLNNEKILKISQLADNKKLELGFVTIIDILRMEEICRNEDKDSKDYEVYHRLCVRGIEVELEDVIEILKIEELIRKGNL